MSRLPPLDLLVPFEAAARLGSFTRAAAELNVTQSAVSQRVRTLEDHLGVALFERAHRAIRLTPQGRELLNGAAAALQHLRAATDSIRSAETIPRVRLAADSSIAGMGLMPRLTAFRIEHVDIALDLTVTDDKAHPDADIAILHGDGDWPGFDATLLFGDTVFPVCAPAYLERHAVRTPDDLLGADLIDLDYLHWNWMNWGIWLTESGLDPAGARRVFQSNSYTAMIEATCGGLGIALGWGRFVDAHLDNGALVRPLDAEVTTPFGYHLALRRNAPDAALTLAEWLIADYGRK